jgi:hypothetical protein
MIAIIIRQRSGIRTKIPDRSQPSKSTALPGTIRTRLEKNGNDGREREHGDNSANGRYRLDRPGGDG